LPCSPAPLLPLAPVGTSPVDSAPEWIKAVLQTSAQNYDKNTPFVVLLDERVTTVKDDGKAETRSRYILRVHNQEGRVAGRREIFYDSQTKISDLAAWHIRADDKVFKLGSRNAIEESIADDLYSDIRSKVMRFREVDIGSVVAFEWVRKEKPLVNQDYHFFQTRSPVLASRYRLNLPAGWKVESFVFNHAPIAPVVDGSSYTWELQNLPPLKEESRMPDIAGLSPFVAVSYSPAGGRAAERSVASWQDVSRWAEDLMERRIRAEEPIEAKAKELTAGIASDIEKVRAISRWVQRSIRYVSIQLGAIGGYRPNPADVVLKKGYGDCKDKSALMQAMLRAVNVESHIVLVFSGDPGRVRPAWPSPLQFNHAIIAIAFESGEPGTTEDSRFNSLLFFDPTDSITPLGDLPFYLQGSYGLVVNGDSGGLVQLPIRPETANHARREVAVKVEETGDIVATVREVATGQLASAARRSISRSSAEEYAREIGARVASDIPGAVISDLKINRDADLEAPLTIEYTVKARRYANRLGKLLVLRPVLLWVQNHPVFTQAEREHPVSFEMRSVKEDFITIELPRGFRVDEMPRGAGLNTAFGEFTLTYEVNEREKKEIFVAVRRRMVINERVVPASGYGEVKQFFDLAQTASQSIMVLMSR
ncbi:MAG: DUF3857 and transglutaminase domain-containing protein, partial [Blastocatellia bacterium]|nr:DUF3857 and transglutaminase domain-containing protein [Blastocatellia bacterium]